MIDDRRGPVATKSARSSRIPPANEDGAGTGVVDELQQVVRDAIRLLRLRIDMMRTRVRLKAFHLVLAVAFAPVALLMLCLGAWYLLSGLAAGLGLVLGNQLWAGKLVVGGLVLLLAALGVWLAARSTRARILRGLHEKYEAGRPSESGSATATSGGDRGRTPAGP